MADESRTNSLKIRIVGYVVMIIFPVFFVLSLEALGRALLTSKDATTYPFLINRQLEDNTDADVFDTRTFMSKLDPHLSHTHGSDAFEGKNTIPGFVIYGAQVEKPTIRIVALGGSTTDPLVEENWPEQLASILDARGIQAHVYNGGVAGYSSNQELLKLIRDVLPLKPDLIVSLSGINDLANLHSVKGHPMVHPYQKKVLNTMTNRTESSSWLFPNAVAAAKLLAAPAVEEGGVEVGFGPTVRTTPAQQWLRNERLMHTIATEFDIPFLGVLQPTMGIGAYTPSANEEKMLEKAINQHSWRGDYEEFVADFYREARSGLEEMPYCIMLVDVFQDRKNMYQDARHQTLEGRKVLAENIFEELHSRGMIPNAP